MNKDAREEYSAPNYETLRFDVGNLLQFSPGGDVGDYGDDKGDEPFDDLNEEETE